MCCNVKKIQDWLTVKLTGCTLQFFLDFDIQVSLVSNFGSLPNTAPCIRHHYD